MKLAILFGLIAAVVCINFVDLSQEEWTEFKATHNKVYRDAHEEKFRYKIYLDNRHKIALHNARYHRKEVSFKLGLNKYSDMLPTEFSSTMNGYNRTIPCKSSVPTLSKTERASTFIAPANINVPESFDWRTRGVVTNVKDQGACGSCWAFSTTGALEAQHYLKTGKLVSLSEQNLLDCSSSYGNHGCDGGWMDYAFKYIKDNAGVDTEDSYPYEGVVDSCRFRSENVGASDTGFTDIASGDEKALLQAVASVGPISAAIDASLSTFHNYREGVYYDEACSSTKLDHAVLIVGYGRDHEKNQDYWLVKNSWGTSWGEQGYVRMIRNMNNNCGIATSASYPLV